MKELIVKKWPEILDILVKEHGISEVAVKTWIQPLTIQNIDENNITFYVVRGDRGIEFIKHKYYDLYLSMAIEQITGRQYNITFTAEAAEEEPQPAPMIKQTAAPAVNSDDNHGLNPRYTFDTFVVGPTNKMAHAVSVAVAESPGETFNPLFLYGGAGLGKTHLMHSIAHYIISHRPDLRVLYVTSEKFTNELIDSLKHDRNKQFRDKYRNIDVLLIDDIQFIIGKESTQEEFFHTFNELHEAKKQIVISSDKPPREFQTLEERLRSRFEWGITADIQPPDYETKMAILKKRAELDHLEVVPEVLQYVATHINSNIRELEGALNKIYVFADLEKKPVTMDLAERALKDTIDFHKEITPQLIMEVVAEHYNITVGDILSKKKNKEIATPRQICMYLCRQFTDYSLQNIGKVMGNRDHTTVLHGDEKIAKLRQTDEYLNKNLEIIIQKLNPPK
ncbi:MAG: chromosomal replication initiator protein DnaA [Lachnospiraceae bacterium]|nr:chromosomal replication initiator protein DnaA [Lachnospiraceae bacterium]